MTGEEDTALRERALLHLKKKHEFRAHLLSFVLVNGFLILIWATVTDAGFFWPAFPLVGWGIGLIFHAWDVYGSEPSEADIAKEMERLRR
jgi:2TM domain